jgi:HD-GYP domain-containing protein (c-di-GMP phosphodiesterase class II)
MYEELSWKEKLVYPFLILFGILLIAAVTPGMALSRENIVFIAIFSLICFFLHHKKFALWILRIQLVKRKKGGATRWIMDEILLFGALFLKGTAAAAWIILLASFSFQLYLLLDYVGKLISFSRKKRERQGKRKPFPYGQVLFGFTSPFNRVIMLVPSGIVYERLNHGAALLSSWRNVAAILAMFLTYFSIATFLSSLTIILRERRTIRKFAVIWWNYYSDLAVPIFMLCPLGVLFALIYNREPYALVLIAVPLIAMHRAMKNYETILEESQKFINSLANALDARDHYTSGHSDRVAKYGRALALAMEKSPQEVDDIERAGRIHDLGKITIPDAILRKQGKLNEEEYAVMKGHAMAVKELFSEKTKLSGRIPVELAYSHHERYDGKGYIFGKKGEEIHPGARILSVADTFDALTSDRPYRKGLDPAVAVGFLKEEAGTQLDPAVVEVFVSLFQKGEIERIMKSESERK